VVDLLIESHGLGILEHLILLNAARRRAAEMSLKVTRQDIDAAHEDALRRLATPMGGPQTGRLDERTAERLLQGFLAAKNISQREWDLRMEQRAYLAKIAGAEVAKMEVTEQMLRQEYERAYGEKVQVRHIQLGSLVEVTRIRALLAEKGFELIARQHSENEFTAAHGGLMPPFTRNDPDIPPLICEMAFGLEVGQVSPAIQEQGRYHLIRLERRFPASDVGFENVDKDALRKRLLDRLTDQWQVALEGELFRSAAVDIRHKALSRQFREKHRGNRGQVFSPE
jgi:parvulin-like peptidyl-prolyl isomerase